MSRGRLAHSRTSAVVEHASKLSRFLGGSIAWRSPDTQLPANDHSVVLSQRSLRLQARQIAHVDRTVRDASDSLSNLRGVTVISRVGNESSSHRTALANLGRRRASKWRAFPFRVDRLRLEPPKHAHMMEKDD